MILILHDDVTELLKKYNISFQDEGSEALVLYKGWKTGYSVSMQDGERKVLGGTRKIREMVLSLAVETWGDRDTPPDVEVSEISRTTSDLKLVGDIISLIMVAQINAHIENIGEHRYMAQNLG